MTKIRGDQIMSEDSENENEKEDKNTVKQPTVEQSIPSDYQNENLSILVE